MKIKKYNKDGWTYNVYWKPFRKRRNKKLLKKGYYNKKWW